MIILNIISSVVVVVAIAVFMNWTPESVTDDLLELARPKDTLKEQSINSKRNKNKHKIYKTLVKLKTAMIFMGRSKQFARMTFLSLVLFAVGIIVGVLMNNVFMSPVLAVAFALLPFLYISNTINTYDSKVKEELETCLSIVTTSYERSDDLIGAVKENIQYIKPPIKEVFLAFLGETTSVSSDITKALYNLKDRIDDAIFHEWCDTLIACQKDRSLKDTIQPVVNKLRDIRTVNGELETMLANVRNEFWMMVLMVVGSVPLVYVLNKDWYEVLMYTTPGKITLAICAATILITTILMFKFTKRVEYKG